MRFIVTDEIRPAVVAGGARLVDLVVSAGPASGGIDVSVRTDFAPVEKSSVPIDRDSIRIAVTHGVDLGARLRCSFWKEIPVGNRVGAVGLGMDADDLAAQIVGVAGRFLRVPRHAARTLVERGVAGRKWIRVVAGGEIEIAFAVEGDGAAGVTALQSLRANL